MKPILTALSYSAGVQSHCILEMVLRGDIEKPESFAVIRANPGMENGVSLQFAELAAQRCEENGIRFITASGPNLYADLVGLPNSTKTRIDNPPYWTKNRETGKRGKLKQLCTGFYKVAPMRRALRLELESKFGISLVTKRIPPVEMWLGFASDESRRVKPSFVKYVTLKYPLIELGMDRAKVEGYYLKNGIPKPPRSVCSACFSNGLAHYEDMYFNRPEDWDKAVAVDDAVRDMTRLGVKDEVFVSPTLVPLRDLPSRNFLSGTSEGKEHKCNSGACFL